MKLFLVEQKRIERDQYIAWVVRASSHRQARKLCTKDLDDTSRAFGELPKYWLEAKYSTCKEITVNGKSEPILGAYFGD